LHDGSIFVRWQKLQIANGSAAHAVRSVQLVKLAALAGSLPPTMRPFPAEDRRRQLAQRAASYARRFAE